MYRYAFDETLARTENTQAGPQHPSYDIQLTGAGDLVLTDTLELETLDFPELQASLESMQMAAASHHDTIKGLAGTGREG